MSTQFSYLTIIALAVFLTACGGGSSTEKSPDLGSNPPPVVRDDTGSNNDSDSSNSDEEEQDSPSEETQNDPPTVSEPEEEAEEPASDDDENSETEQGEEEPSQDNDGTPAEQFDGDVAVHFPWRSSTVTGSSLTFRGEVPALPPGYQLLINGEPVELIETPVSTASAKPGLSGYHSHASMKSTAAASEEVIVPQATSRWEYIEQEVATGVVEYVIQVVDANGNPATPENLVKVERKLVPTSFDFDPVSRRLVGLAGGQTGMELVDLDVVTGSTTQDDSIMTSIPVGSCHKRDTDELIYLTVGHSQSDPESTYFVFHRAPLSSDADQSVFHTQPQPDGGNQELALLCDPTRSRVYLVVNRHFFAEADERFSIVYELDTSGNQDEPWSTLFQGDLWKDEGIAFNQATLAEDHILIYANQHEVTGKRGIYRISLEDGELESVALDYDEFGTMIAQGSEPEELYTVHFEGVDILNGEVHTRISDQDEDHDFLYFDQIRGAALDREENRLLVGDSGLNLIMGIDLDTGAREAVFSPGQGVGPKLLAARAMAVASDFQSAYVIDDGGNTPEKLVRINLDTGDRDLIAILRDDGFNQSAPGLALDETEGLLYAVRGNSIYRIDGENGDMEIIASPDDVRGAAYTYLSQVVFDEANQRLLVAAPLLLNDDDPSDSGAILAIDLNDEDYTRTVISKAGVKGEGATLNTVNGLALPSDGGILYVGDQYAGAIYEIDLETGDRTALTPSCNLLGLQEDESLKAIALSADESVLMMTWEGTTFIDLESGECVNHINDFSAHRLIPARGDSLFSLELKGLYLLDPETLEKVIVSQ
ncbi:hypothetical protein [Marinimicrobium sp. ABcell2]|uniref:hypothetical protein n=1 Tax=Marinimicrobium sp. ABcell2 TaxID=3069751 RepID=UPI0027B5C23C|nr:hypothetical protein [Marinimicrobium sp. ABcell2]MDQ2075916.1 hypothetical protein [Marinimicrobium sp. ABcell2]